MMDVNQQQHPVTLKINKKKLLYKALELFCKFLQTKRHNLFKHLRRQLWFFLHRLPAELSC